MTAVLDPRATILDVLERQCALHRRLLQNAKQQREALLQADVAWLGTYTREMELLTAEVERLEEQRIAHVRQLTGRDGATASWRELEPVFGDAAPSLQARRDELLDLLRQVRSVNDGNAALIRRAQSLGERWSRILRGLMPTTYDARGSLLAGRPTRRAWSA
jgi:flagellar biosynthesis/type III secretory pathway chaperone